jgi:hypothetical protein
MTAWAKAWEAVLGQVVPHVSIRASALAGAGNGAELVLAHERVLADNEQPGRQRQPDLDACGPRYVGPRKLAMNFLKYLATLGPGPSSTKRREVLLPSSRQKGTPACVSTEPPGRCAGKCGYLTSGRVRARPA